jgi:galactose mutarotase-like enzyme
MHSFFENDLFLIEADTKGAELTRLHDKKGDREVLWRGAPQGWTGHAPILFPVVGGLKDDGYFLEGKRYSLIKHGFASIEEFELCDDSDGLRYLLRESASTLSQYPFPFELCVRYSFADNLLVHECMVTNTGTKNMYFSLGFHPAFNWEAGDYIEIDGIRQARAHRLDSNNQFLLTKEKETLPFDDGKLFNRPELFRKGAWVFDDLPEHDVSLVSPERAMRLTIHHQAPVFGLWGGPPFCAIEPWYGIDDLPDTNGNLEEKPYIVCTAPGESWKAHITFEVSNLE